MRYGILSDIHGNLEALEAVLERLEAAGASQYLCLGDIVGYGADPDACCSRVRLLPGPKVIGNHDLAAIGGLDLKWFHEMAAESLRWTGAQLAPANRQFLRELPERAGGGSFEMVHGSPQEPVTGYLVDEYDARVALEMQAEPLCFVGHTHVPAAFARPAGSLRAAAVEFRSGQPLRIRPDFVYNVNCGSVGQPRDGDPRAACGLYDSDDGTVECLRVPYDVGRAQAKIRAAGLPSGLAERLAQGR